MKIHYTPADRPLDPIALIILQEVVRATKQWNSDYFIVGATARDILLTHVFGMDIRRATTDVDFAIAVKDWAQFENIKSSLIQVNHFYASATSKQRLFYRSTHSGYGYPFDLIPFGGVEHPDNVIAWPPDMATMMTVTGYGEVLAASAESRWHPIKLCASHPWQDFQY
ncbi:hypothetical protein ACVBEF_03385 [Glaciimonas sp. GG7]